jgi:hypothetical protein
MTNQETGIDGDAALEAVEPLAERRPPPVESGPQRVEAAGASVKPQLPPKTVVTPCCTDGLAVGSQNSCAS